MYRPAPVSFALTCNLCAGAGSAPGSNSPSGAGWDTRVLPDLSLLEVQVRREALAEPPAGCVEEEQVPRLPQEHLRRRACPFSATWQRPMHAQKFRQNRRRSHNPATAGSHALMLGLIAIKLQAAVLKLYSSGFAQ